MSLIDYLLSLIAPYDCLGCTAEGALLCKDCASVLPAPTSYDDQKSLLTTVKAVTGYNGAAKALVWRLKSNGAQAAADIMATQMIKRLVLVNNILIVPIPTASGRVRQRGYDQAKLLARALARQAGLPYVDCLVRTGQTHQVGASRAQRLQQLRLAFRVRRPATIRSAHLLLVDDVTTTGATLELAADVLRSTGARRIDAIVFAQA